MTSSTNVRRNCTSTARKIWVEPVTISKQLPPGTFLLIQRKRFSRHFDYSHFRGSQSRNADAELLLSPRCPVLTSILIGCQKLKHSFRSPRRQYKLSSSFRVGNRRGNGTFNFRKRNFLFKSVRSRELMTIDICFRARWHVLIFFRRDRVIWTGIALLAVGDNFIEWNTFHREPLHALMRPGRE